MIRIYIRGKYLLTALSVLVAISVFSQEGKKSSYGLFDSPDLAELTLKFDMGKFTREKPKESFVPGEMIMINNKNLLYADIRVRSRGNFRNRNCDFPPVMLNLKESNTGYSDLDDMRNVKLVSHCMPDESYEVFILREFLAYRLYNIITDNSFRVKLLDIDYYDIETDTLFASRMGFLLEPVRRIEKRIGATELEDTLISLSALDFHDMMNLVLFQFMIGNGDWFIPTIHNLKLFRKSEDEAYIALPYDFDYSGWVNTDYSVPREGYGLDEIRDRLYLGPCIGREELKEALEYFALFEEEFIDTIKDFKYLTALNRRDLISYVKKFFKMYKDDEIIDIILDQCKK